MALEREAMDVRLPVPADEALRETESSRGTSMKEVAEDPIAIFAVTRRKDRLRTAFARLAETEHNVEFAFDAQVEVVLARA